MNGNNDACRDVSDANADARREFMARTLKSPRSFRYEREKNLNSVQKLLTFGELSNAK